MRVPRTGTVRLADDVWWTEMTICNVARRPLTRLLRWLQQPCSRFRSEAECPQVLQLVWSRGGELMQEYGSLLEAPAMSDIGLWGRLHDEGGTTWRPTAFLCVLECAVDAYRRLVVPLGLFPMRLAWLVKSGPEVVCRKRAGVAAAMIAGDMPAQAGHGVDAFSGKLLATFRRELEEAAASGRLDTRLHCLICTTFRALLPTTQEVESMNSQIRRMVTLSPSIGLPLLSSRPKLSVCMCCVLPFLGCTIAWSMCKGPLPVGECLLGLETMGWRRYPGHEARCTEEAWRRPQHGPPRPMAAWSERAGQAMEAMGGRAQVLALRRP